MNRSLLHIIIIICCLYLNQGISQNNPFNIEGRENVIDISKDSIYQEAANVFDQTMNPSAATKNDNPFEVSHIPLKKTEVAKKRTRIIDRQDPTSDFGDIKFWVLLFTCFLFAIIMFLYRQFILSLHKPLLNENYLKTLGRETNAGKNTPFTLLYLLFFLNASLFVYSLFEYFSNSAIRDYRIYLYVFLGVVGIYIGKHLLLGFTGYVYPFTKELRTYNFTTTVLHSILGIILIPINLLAILGPDPSKAFFLYFGSGIIVLFFFVRLFKGFSGSSRLATSHLYYFFLYLCTSEIAPLVIMYSLIMRY